MSEHTHYFIWFHGRFECEECCRSKEAIDLEQQLAQAQADAATMRALLEETLTDAWFIKEDEQQFYCPSCMEHAKLIEAIPHEESCLVLKIRAFLAAHPTQEQTDG